MSEFNIESQIENQIEKIIDTADQIEPYKITILTGSNGSGKSMVRKQLTFKLCNKIPEQQNNYGKLTADVSMQRRTESNPYLGALGSFMHDSGTDPTSISTYQHIDTLLNSFTSNKEKVINSKRYLIIDEPEIGMSKESQLGFVEYLLSRTDEILEHTYGLLIITHSECLVQALTKSEYIKDKVTFLNLDGYATPEEWINREIKPVNLEELAERSHKLFIAINERMKSNKEQTRLKH